MDSSVFRGDSGPMPLDFMGESGREPNDLTGDVSLDRVEGDVCCVLGDLEGDSWKDLTGEPSLDPFCASNRVSGLSFIGDSEVSIASGRVRSFTDVFSDLDGEVGRLDFVGDFEGETEPLPLLAGFSGDLISTSSSGVRLVLAALIGL